MEWCYFHLQTSHLSCGDGDVRSRTCRKRQRRSAIRQQRQLMVLLFLCRFANARAMGEQGDVKTAFLQRMTSMAEAATRAAAAAERALETASRGAPGANEGLSAVSRILKSPDVFSGDDPMIFNSGRSSLPVGFPLVTHATLKPWRTRRRSQRLHH